MRYLQKVGNIAFVVGVTLLVCFGAVAFEGGIIADETGGVGSATAVQEAIGLTGVILSIVGAAMWAFLPLRDDE